MDIKSVIKLALYFYLLLINVFKSNGQITVFYNEVDNLSSIETKEINTRFDKNNPVTSINIFPAFVEWRYYPDWTVNRKVYRKIDSIYFKKKSLNDSSFLINSSLEAFYKKKVNGKLYYDLKKNIKEINKIKLNNTDSVFIINELKRISDFLNHSHVTEYKMSDSLYEVLKNYPGQHQVLYDLLACQGDLHQSRTVDLFGMQRIYVFDMMTKTLIYYKYNKIGVYADSVHFWLTLLYDRSPTPFLFEDFPKPEKVLKEYMNYLKK